VTLGSAAAAWPLVARAQRPVPVIAVLGSGAADSASSTIQMQLLGAGMRELGLVEGKDYVFEARWAGSDSSRIPALAAELLALHPAAVVVSTNLAVTTVQNLSRIVPIVGADAVAGFETGCTRRSPTTTLLRFIPEAQRAMDVSIYESI
jgi:putative ABC transport system substrate-binding protein